MLLKVTLRDLVNARYLDPQKDCVVLHHKGMSFTGTLDPDGFILYEGEEHAARFVPFTSK
jgi:hypothetical protein